MAGSFVEATAVSSHLPVFFSYVSIQAKIVVLACQKPADLGWVGQTHWTLQDLAGYIREHPELGLGAPSKSTVHRMLQAHDLRLDRL
jgi:hypothetical protein